MFKKITALIAAAVSAAAALSCTVSAGYTDGWETVVDKSGIVQAYRVELPDENDPNISTVYYADESGERLDGLLYANFSNRDSIAPNFRLTEFDGGKVSRYVTGFTQSAKGKRYYIRGERAYGWHRIKGYWYHFNTRNGYMDTGKTVIGGSVYSFDEKGRWTYRVSKDGLAPEDFSVRFISNGGRGFDTDEKKIYYGYKENGEGAAEASVKISARDRQILWCMYLESGFEQGCEETFDEDYTVGFCESFFKPDTEFEVYSSEPETVWSITVNMGDTSSKLGFNTDADQIALIDEKTFRADLLYSGYGRYLSELEEKYPYAGEPLMTYE
ncbi:MAG: hypothetical protein NC395_10725 [Prevotella sp.]|nr:hypothetical protein [Prevotella sp.]